MNINQDNFSYSILLSINEGKSKWSWFRLKYKGYNIIVSAKHVLFDEKEKLYGENLTITCHSSPLWEGHLIFWIDLREAKIYSSKSSDICIVLFGKNECADPNQIPLKYDKNNHKRPASLELEDYITVIEQTWTNLVSVDIEATRNLKEIGIANEVYLMGYPTSLWLANNSYFDYTKPLIRKGIISGINSKEQTFIIDCPSYQGNSGGPVIEHWEDWYFRVIGLVSKYIPFETTWYNNRERWIKHTEVENSGFSVCIPFDKIIELIEDNIDNF